MASAQMSLLTTNARDFEKVLSDYDLVLNSQDRKTLEKSLHVLKPGGQLISISGLPDPAFADAFGLSPLLKFVVRLLSRGARKKAKTLGVHYSFPVHARAGAAVERDYVPYRIRRHPARRRQVFPFEKTADALGYVETGRVKGRVVVTVAE